LVIKDVNINPSRVGVITILKKMGVNIIYLNKRKYKGERIADIKVKSPRTLKSINCPTNLNSGAIDEFLIIFLVAAKANGVSYFKDLSELIYESASENKIASHVYKNNLTLFNNGINAVSCGLTSLAEIFRISDADE